MAHRYRHIELTLVCVRLILMPEKNCVRSASLALELSIGLSGKNLQEPARAAFRGTHAPEGYKLTPPEILAQDVRDLLNPSERHSRRWQPLGNLVLVLNHPLARPAWSRFICYRHSSHSLAEAPTCC